MRFLPRIHIRNHRRGIFPPVIAVFLMVSGFGLVGYGAIDQTHIPSAPPSSAEDTSATQRHGHSTTLHARSKPAQPSPDRINLHPSKPVHIRIPAIDVDSEVTKIGKNPDGTIDVPEGANYDKPAWYKHSSHPGQVGPTMIEGHVDSEEGGASVFFRLAQLKPGEDIYIERADGKVVVYQVDRVREYKKHNFPTDAVYGPTERATLRLVTCGGRFLQDIGEYESNMIAFATLKDIRNPS